MQMDYAAIVNPRASRPLDLLADRDAMRRRRERERKERAAREWEAKLAAAEARRARGAERNDRPTMKLITIAFDDETFDVVASIAVKERRSFAAVVRELVDWGLEDYRKGQEP